ncbi:hypothetical protein HDK77DRAFT_252243 [Phyllosticta capitalensis]
MPRVGSAWHLNCLLKLLRSSRCDVLAAERMLEESIRRASPHVRAFRASSGVDGQGTCPLVRSARQLFTTTRRRRRRLSACRGGACSRRHVPQLSTAQSGLAALYITPPTSLTYAPQSHALQAPCLPDKRMLTAAPQRRAWARPTRKSKHIHSSVPGNVPPRPSFRLWST